MSFYRTLAVAALLLHLLWLAWVALGWLLTRRRPLLRSIHIGSLVYGILIEVFRWPCPLTLVEVAFVRRAGRVAYREPFLVHYLESIVYPDLSEAVVTAGAVMVCVAVLLVYVRRYRRRTAAGW